MPDLASTVNVDKTSTADWVLEQLQDPRRRNAFLAAIDEGLEAHPPRRHIVRLYAEMLKLVGAERTLAVMFLQKYGASNEAELMELVGLGKGAKERASAPRTPRMYAEKAAELLRRCCRLDPTCVELVRELAGSINGALAPIDGRLVSNIQGEGIVEGTNGAQGAHSNGEGDGV